MFIVEWSLEIPTKEVFVSPSYLYWYVLPGWYLKLLLSGKNEKKTIEFNYYKSQFYMTLQFIKDYIHNQIIHEESTVW